MEEHISTLHKFYETVKPNSLIGEELKTELNNLFEFIKPNFLDFIKKPDGSRVYQVLYRKADEKLRGLFLDIFLPHIYEASISKYQYHVVLCIIKRSNKDQRTRVYESLLGNYEKLLKHRIGILIVEELFDHLNSHQKNRLLFDFYGPNRDKFNLEKLNTFKDLCKIGSTERIVSIKHLKNLLEISCDKNLGKYKIIQKLILILGEEDMSSLGSFIVHINDLSFSPDGSEVAIKCIIKAKQNEIKGAIKLIEPHERKNMINIIEEDKPDNEGEDIEEEDQGEEEDNKEPEIILNNTSKLATDKNAWRVLSCAISYLDDPTVVIEEIIPNLLDFWDHIYNNEYLLKVFLRMLTTVDSVYRSLNFQRNFVNEELIDITSKTLIEKVINNLTEICSKPDGSRLIVELLKVSQKNDSFEKLFNSLFIKDFIIDKIMHKVIKLTIKTNEKKFIKKTNELINEIGLENVLKTPGAWIIESLTINDSKLLNNVKKIIEKNKIEGKAIEAILNPKTLEEKQKIYRNKFIPHHK